MQRWAIILSIRAHELAYMLPTLEGVHQPSRLCVNIADPRIQLQRRETVTGCVKVSDVPDKN